MEIGANRVRSQSINEVINTAPLQETSKADKTIEKVKSVFNRIGESFSKIKDNFVGLGHTIKELGAGKILHGITKHVAGVFVRTAANVTSDPARKKELIHYSRDLKHQAITTAAKGASIFFRYKMKCTDENSGFKLINIAKHEDIIGDSEARPEDTKAAKSLIDKMLEKHTVRNERTNKNVQITNARAKLREHLEKIGMAPEEIETIIQDTSKYKEVIDNEVHKFRAERDKIMNETGENPLKTENQSLKNAQKDLDEAKGVQSYLNSLISKKAERKNSNEKTGNTIHLCEDPSKPFEKSGLVFLKNKTEKLNAVRDGVCFGSTIHWASLYHKIQGENPLNQLEQAIMQDSTKGMAIEASANQLTYQGLVFHPRVDYTLSKEHVGVQGRLEALNQLLDQLDWNDEHSPTLKNDIKTLINLYENGRAGIGDKGTLYDNIVGGLRETPYWKEQAAYAGRSPEDFANTLSQIAGNHPHPLLQNPQKLIGLLQLYEGLKEGKSGMKALNEISDPSVSYAMNRAYSSMADKKVSGFIAQQRGYSYGSMEHLFGPLSALDSDQQFLNSFEDNFDQMPDGFYHFDIDVADAGHSMCMVKEGNKLMLIDPNWGNMKVEGAAAAKAMLTDLLGSYSDIPKEKKPPESGNTPFHAPRIWHAVPSQEQVGT